MTKEEFAKRFSDYMQKHAGFTHFDDGTAVVDYAADVVESYWSDVDYRQHGPEECASSNMDCWGEE